MKNLDLKKKTILIILILNSIILQAQNDFSIGYDVTVNHRMLKAKTEPYKTTVKRLDSSEIKGIGHNAFINYKIKLNDRISILTQADYSIKEYKTKKKDGNIYDDITQQKIKSDHWETYRYNFVAGTVGVVLYSKNKQFSITPQISYQRLLRYWRKSYFYVPNYKSTSVNGGYYSNDTSKVKNNYSVSINLGYSLAALRLPNFSVNMKGEYFLNSIYSNKSIKNHLWNVGVGVSMAILPAKRSKN